MPAITSKNALPVHFTGLILLTPYFHPLRSFSGSACSCALHVLLPAIFTPQHDSGCACPPLVAVISLPESHEKATVMLHYLLYELPGDILTLHAAVVDENPALVLLAYCLIVLWLILLFSRH